MVKLRIDKADTEIEKRILTGAIVSDRACRELVRTVKDDTFTVPYVAKIFGWVVGYYLKYNSAPGKEIQNIFNIRGKKLKLEEKNLINVFLSKLSEEYEEQEFLNEDLLLNDALRYVSARSYKSLADGINHHLLDGDTDSIKELLSEHKEIQKATSGWTNPFERERIIDHMSFKGDVLFRFPGKLGELCGDFERGFFIAFLAPVKRGKTWTLIELATIALTQKLKVAFISLEMSERRMAKRFYKQVLSVGGSSAEVCYPVFDCEWNQDGSCERVERISQLSLQDDDGYLPDFDPSLDYRVCTYCRDNRLKDYQAATWFEQVKRPEFKTSIVADSIGALWSSLGLKNFRLKCYPRMSANLSQVIGDLDALEYTEGFRPDVILIDYIDILAREHQYDDPKEMINETWMKSAGLAEERKCAFFTVSQSTKKAWGKKNVIDQDISEYYMKLAHVDLAMSLSQTREEKNLGRIRLGVIERREGFFDQYRQVTVLQQLEAGQALLDSEFAPDLEE